MQENVEEVNEKVGAEDIGDVDGFYLGRQISNGWSFIFEDPTFGGECPHIPFISKRPSQEWNVPPMITEALPAGVQEMLLGGPAEDESPAAGSGMKAAEYLRRMSNDSDGSGLSDSGLSGSSFGAETPRDKKKAKDNSGLSDSGSGFSDVSEKGNAAEDKYGSERSAGSKKSKNSSKESKTGGGTADNLEHSSGSLPQNNDLGPSRQNRRADTIVAEKKDDGSDGGLSGSDPDLLTNPFASDSEEDRAPMESARSMKSNKSQRSSSAKQ